MSQGILTFIIKTKYNAKRPFGLYFQNKIYSTHKQTLETQTNVNGDKNTRISDKNK